MGYLDDVLIFPYVSLQLFTIFPIGKLFLVLCNCNPAKQYPRLALAAVSVAVVYFARP